MESSHGLTSMFVSSILKLALAVILFIVLRIIYRLTFHPLARFPGPKLAAASSLWAASYDITRSPSLVKTLPELHAKYGPIVRTYPNQLHFKDLDSYHEVFKTGSKFDKDTSFYNSPPTSGSLFLIPDFKALKPRKDMYHPYFSKAAIQRLEPLIQEQVSKFLDILQGGAREHRTLDLNLGYRCLTADVVMYYCYQKTFGALDAPEFQSPFMLALDEFFRVLPWGWYFPNLIKFVGEIISKLPSSITQKYFGPVAATQWIQKQCHDRIMALKARPKVSPRHTTLPTVFDTILNPDPSKGQYTPSDKDLTADAFVYFGAGTDTTANTLVIGTFHVLSNPRILHKLKNELREAMPNKDNLLNWSALENLPYLRAVIKESLRLGYGVPGKMPRVVPSSGATFCGQKIPAGTVVSHSAYVYHTDESVFPDAHRFVPERWLDVNQSATTDLDSKMLSFSRGSRSCLGINLAYAELYLTFAHMLRKFDLTLFETGDEDMEWDDTFVPMTRGHLKIFVKEEVE